mmetsp:Transcript_97305/g.275342  ORF Transcript_97305/g.275342 Transcript_97305/m.275342 type:complete len:247 (+) Transcript_97305:115-855(+)
MGQHVARICSPGPDWRPQGGVPCGAAVAEIQHKVSREEFKLHYFGKVVTDMARALDDGLLSPCIAMQFASQTRVNQVVPYRTRACAEKGTGKVLEALQELAPMLDCEPRRQIVEGRVWPLAEFAYDKPYSLIRCGMSFTTYPLKPGVTSAIWNGLYTNQVVSTLGREFGMLWLFSAVGSGPDGHPMGIVSGLYQCPEAAIAVQPKIGVVLDRMGALDLLSDLPYERTVGVGYAVRKPSGVWRPEDT